ncbi:RNA polymerase sigma-70 factor (ECF subfamily) [Chitinophaga niastensis]|uniref:RNA polymerase sigma-70 factor (ECF subfamily) n=1 Tax=Chitinophaga niastensis TaxID=536980 RepID=A0A2P8HIY5_CHINA|nr:sigma-70 family RNA polymerase sigma factor [Chitinophaga niastensis]PSL46186.1 RNA polymerase sigma-70 factor (ECF subfamily) [Chitinophaga niastensis]
MADSKLWEEFQSGHTAAFESIFHAHWDKLMLYTCSIIADDALAKDVLQNFFIELWEKRTTLPLPRETGAFLVFLLKLRILNALRSEDIRSRHEHNFAALLHEHTTNTVDQLQVKEIYAQLHQYTNLLPPRIRQVFYLSRFEHKTIPEIAGIVGASEQTVRNQLNTANKRLKLQLKSSFLSFFL